MRAPPMIYRALCAVTIAALALGAGTACAQDADEARRRAHELFAESREHYREGRFERAVELLREAHALHEEPVLLYNLARALEGMGSWAEAADAYARYLDAEPSAPDRGAIEQRVATLRRAADEAVREPPPAPLPPRELPPPAPSGPSAGPFVLMGLGGAGLATGAVLGGLALERRDAATNDPVHASAAAALRDAEAFALATNVTLVVAGVVAAAGLVWGIVEWTSGGGDDDARATFRLGAGPGGLALHGRAPLLE